MRRLIASVIAVLALVVSPGIALGQPAGSAIVQNVDLSNFPRVGLEVILPESLVSQGETPVFSVKENGRETELVKAQVQAADQPIDAVLVVDCSGSMAGAPIQAAKSAARAFVAELRPPSRAALVTFADRPRVVVPPTADGAALRAAIDGITPAGETSLYDAVITAVRQVNKSGSAQPVVIVLSDGGDTMSRTPLTRALSELRSAKVPVLAVALSSDEADPKALRLLSSQSGGRMATISNLDQLTSFYTGLARELQTRYLIAYSSNRPSTADLEISVTAKSSTGAAVTSLVVSNPMAAIKEPIGKTVKPVPPANLITYGVAVTLVFVAVALLTAAVILILIRPRTGLDQLAFYDQVVPEGGDNAVGTDRVISGMIGAVDYVAGKGGFKRLAYEELDRAGLPLRPTEYIGMHLTLVVVAGLLAGGAGNLVGALLVVVITTILPIGWIAYRIERRKRQFEEQLPDMLDLLAGSLRAGWGLQQATEVIVEQCGSPMSDEFRRAQTEIRLGRSVEEALESVAVRMQSNDFGWVVSAISIQREVGGNLAELLTIVSGTIRERNALKREISALTSEGRLSAVILFALPFFEAVVLYLVNREYMSKLFLTGPGLVMLVMGLAMLGVGGVWLKKATKVEV